MRNKITVWVTATYTQGRISQVQIIIQYIKLFLGFFLAQKNIVYFIKLGHMEMHVGPYDHYVEAVMYFLCPVCVLVIRQTASPSSVSRVNCYAEMDCNTQTPIQSHNPPNPNELEAFAQEGWLKISLVRCQKLVHTY